ncbi:MAG: TrkH family potassium uptake protein [Clostridia bacterium]|nr:TrkH family potassium uptake protein [Clostridia bacterium]
MYLNFRFITKFIGLVFIITGVCMLPALIVAVIYGENVPASVFGACAVSSCLAGLATVLCTGRAKAQMKLRDGFLTVTLTWVTASAIGAFPFFFTGCVPSFVDAFFESASAFTSTGASVISNPEALPKSIIFWRSFSAWCGTLSLILFAVVILPGLRLCGQILPKAETFSALRYSISPKHSPSAKKIYTIYFGLTALEILLLLPCRAGFFDIVIHSLGTISTSGFSSHATSCAYFESAYVDFVTIVFMFAAGVSFLLYFKIVSNPSKIFSALGEDSELKLYGVLLSVSTLLLLLNLLFERIYSSPFEVFRHSLFQTASLLSTTGFSSTNYDLWPSFCHMILFMLMLSGACSTSCGSGIKVIRVLVTLKLLKRSLSIRLHPNAVLNVKVANNTQSTEYVTSITGYIFLYIAVFFISCILVSFDNLSLTGTISSVLACLNNIGSGFDFTGCTGSFTPFSYFSKTVLSVLMIAGRLELFTFFMLLSPNYWNPDRCLN